MTELKIGSSYEEQTKLIWKAREKRWEFMSQEEKCQIVNQMNHTPYSWIPKSFIAEVFRWFYDAFRFGLIEHTDLVEIKRANLRLIEPNKANTKQTD